MASELGVQTIQHTNGTDALTIDSSGRVTQPQVIAFCGQKGDITASGGEYSTAGNITFNNSRLSHSAWDGTTFTAPVAGKYQFSLTGHRQSTSTAAPIELQVRKGSTVILSLYSLDVAATRPRVSGNCIVELAVNDTVTFYLAQGNVFAGGGNSSSGVTCSGHFLG
jgi:hypothetical protein